MIYFQPKDTAEIAEALKADLVVAIPTETVYGLAISLDSAPALQKLISLKQRGIDSGKVFTLIPESSADISKYAIVNDFAQTLIDRFIPGEITLILPKNPNFCHPYFNHFETIGVRIPNHTIFTQMLMKSGPLLLTSANPRGEVPANTSNEVLKTLPQIDAVVVGESGHHTPSTIVDCTGASPKILRQGDLKI